MSNSGIKMLLIGLIALMMGGIASAQLPVTCSLNISVDPGEHIVLDGSSTPEVTYPVTNVSYSWLFTTAAGVGYEVNNTTAGKSGVVEQPVNTSTFTFDAPVEPGCYKAGLTLYYWRNVSTETGILNETCVNYTCIDICVDEYNCSLCDNAIFCYSAQPTDGSCPRDWCYTNATEGATVDWYVTLLSQMPNSVWYSQGNCTDIDWSDTNVFSNDTYVVEMAVSGLNGAGVYTEFFRCDATVSQVEDPVAEITRTA